MGVLVIDVGTSGIRCVVVHADGTIIDQQHRECLPASPQPGFVEFDPRLQADIAIGLARDAIGRTGPVDAIAVTNQRGSTVCWDRATGEPVGNGLGWQDQRAKGHARRLLSNGIVAGPGSMGPTAAWQVERSGRPVGELCVGTVDTWITWNLTEGREFVTDASNLSGGLLWSSSHEEISPLALKILGLPRELFADIVDTCGVLGLATALPGVPPIAALAGDQMASLIGHGAVSPGEAKITFGTGAMLDVTLGETPVDNLTAMSSGCLPMVARRSQGQSDWMLEAVMAAAGANLEWLRDGLGIISDTCEVDSIASQCVTSGGVFYVPAILGLGTPSWDSSARGTLFGITPSSTRAQIVRAVLEGVAQQAADLVDAAERQGELVISRLSVDGGMSRSQTFVQAVADATGLEVDVACEPEMTSLGAALLAGIGIGTWSDRSDLNDAWAPKYSVSPEREFDRAVWHEACRRATSLTRPLTSKADSSR